MKSLSTYRKVFRDVYPKLRTAKTEILVVKDKKTDAEMSVLSKQVTQNSVSADTLSFEEMMYSATLTPSLDEKAAIMNRYKERFKLDAHNNVARVLAQALENSANAESLATKLLRNWRSLKD